MVVKFVKDGIIVHGPPYTKAGGQSMADFNIRCVPAGNVARDGASGVAASRMTMRLIVDALLAVRRDHSATGSYPLFATPNEMA
jgi:hypothetical protein